MSALLSLLTELSPSFNSSFLISLSSACGNIAKSLHPAVPCRFTSHVMRHRKKNPTFVNSYLGWQTNHDFLFAQREHKNPVIGTLSLIVKSQINPVCKQNDHEGSY